MHEEVDRRIKAAGAHNAYFPLLMPMSFSSAKASISRDSVPSWPW